MQETINLCICGNTGHFYHRASGLYLAPYRAYNSKLGKWLSREPLGLDGPNLYHYGFGNPINGIDPTGLSFWGRVGNAAIAGVSGAASGAATGAGTGAVIGAVVGSGAGGIGAAPGAAAGAAAGALVGGISNGVGGFIGGLFHGPDLDAKGAAIDGAIGGARLRRVLQ